MPRLHQLTHAVGRRLFSLAVLSGVRAGSNRARSRWLGTGSLADALDGATFRSARFGELRTSVHSRPRPANAPWGARFGLVSLRQVRPRIAPLLYRYLCLTTHFGCGHVEVAYFERAGRVTIYAIRNAARSSAQRLGLSDAADRLLLTKRDESRWVLEALLVELRGRGIDARLAAPQECVALAVTPRLIHPARRPEALRVLKRKYEKLQVLNAG